MKIIKKPIFLQSTCHNCGTVFQIEFDDRWFIEAYRKDHEDGLADTFITNCPTCDVNVKIECNGYSNHDEGEWVHVVRCKHCEFYQLNGYCKLVFRYRNPDAFCDLGKRKEQP